LSGPDGIDVIRGCQWNGLEHAYDRVDAFDWPTWAGLLQVAPANSAMLLIRNVPRMSGSPELAHDGDRSFDEWLSAAARMNTDR
jgi:hypothetical protein